MVCILNPHYFKGTNGLEICVGAIQDSEDVIIIRTTDDYETQQQTFIKDARLKLCKNGIKRKDAIRFIKELVTEDFNTYIPFVSGIDEFKTTLPSGAEVRLGPDHQFPYIVVKTLPNGEYIMRSSRHQDSFGTNIPKVAVETAAFSSWQGQV